MHDSIYHLVQIQTYTINPAWYCNQHYREICDEAGRELNIKATLNIFKHFCMDVNCYRVADVLVDTTIMEL